MVALLVYSTLAWTFLRLVQLPCWIFVIDLLECLHLQLLTRAVEALVVEAVVGVGMGEPRRVVAPQGDDEGPSTARHEEIHESQRAIAAAIEAWLA